MKTIFYFLILSTCVIFNSGCEVYAQDGGYIGGAGGGYYSVSTLYGEGVDDYGKMWFGISGSFDSHYNDVQVECDGQPVDVLVETQSQTFIEISMPAVSHYGNCNFSVDVQGQTVGTVSMTDVTAMEISKTSIELDPNPSYLDVTLQGTFFIQTMRNSELSVTASCDGGSTTFSPRIIYESPSAVTVLITNPGYNQTEKCEFEMQDTFVDNHNNQITVWSPSYPVRVYGQL